VLDQTGTRAAMEVLKRDAQLQTETVERATASIERETDSIKIDQFMNRIRQSLDEVRIDSGVSTDAYQPDKIMARITEIEKDAGVTEVETAVL
jgi:DNA repair photolyase